jgi:glycosyltransferase involved in cell wall biosynthesis
MDDDPQIAANAGRAALWYISGDFDTSQHAQVLGRHAASESLLVALARYAADPELTAFAGTREAFEDFERQARAANGTRDNFQWIPTGMPERLGEKGCLLLSDPALADWAWIRRHYDQRLFSLCGLTHTISSGRAMQRIADLLTAPVQSWDAVICTSNAARSVITTHLENTQDYLTRRFGAASPPRPQFPVIPLGIHCDAFAPTDEAKARGRAFRSELGIADDDVAVLYLGRVSYHAKAHPLPMYLALEQVARRTGRRIHLLTAGRPPNKIIADHFRAGAKASCPSLRLTWLDTHSERVRNDVRHAADIYVSLSDNIQETFGLSPVEAMAAGLPVVVSDWNGYRDTVRHGEDGFRVGTWLPPAGTGLPVARDYLAGNLTYDRYVGQVSGLTSVDLKETIDAVEALVGNADLRRRMGAAGEAHASEDLDWRIVVPRYEALWRELAERRAKDRESAASATGRPPSPLSPDPFAAFSVFSTHVLGRKTRVGLAPGGDLARFHQQRALDMNLLAAPRLCRPEPLERAVRHCQDAGEVVVGDLVDRFAPAGEEMAFQRSLVWLAKLGVLRLRQP